MGGGCETWSGDWAALFLSLNQRSRAFLDMESQLAGLSGGLRAGGIGGRGSKGATGLEPARSTCGSMGPLGGLVVGIGGSLTRKGEEGCIGGSGVGERARICSICWFRSRVGRRGGSWTTDEGSVLFTFPNAGECERWGVFCKLDRGALISSEAWSFPGKDHAEGGV